MKYLALLLATSLLLATTSAHSRNTRHMFSIEQALQSADFKQRLDPEVRLYFGDQKHPDKKDYLGRFPTSKKTNAFNKTDKQACQWVLLSALLALQERARIEGGNAVINIASYYNKQTVSSSTEYECRAGEIVAGVALIGDVVTLAK